MKKRISWKRKKYLVFSTHPIHREIQEEEDGKRQCACCLPARKERRHLKINGSVSDLRVERVRNEGEGGGGRRR
jgi:hypothetical protein